VDERTKRVERFFNWPVIVAALLVIPVIVIEYTAVSDTVKSIATVCNWAIWLVFAAELVAILWVVPNRWHWLVHNPLDVLIVVLTPPILPPGLQTLRVLRLLRLLRLLKLAQVSRRVFSSTFSSDIAHAVSPGVGEVASLPPAPEKPRRSGLREAEKGDYRDHKRDDQDDAEGVHLPQ
jgi:hypothetical protein